MPQPTTGTTGTTGTAASPPTPASRWPRRAALRGLAGAGALAAIARAGWATGAAQEPPPPTPLTGHPRLWLTADDLPRLRSWATATNPIWQEGLLVRAESAVANMDAGFVPAGDGGGLHWEEYPTETYAELFAFLSLIHPDETARADFAQRAKSLLMYVIDAAAAGPAPEQPFADPAFSIRNRSRWWGEALPLTVDWIYPILSDDEKATIRQVFLRWIDENIQGGTTTSDHPEPIGVVNDPVLLADPLVLRWAGNNYFTAHMRNIGLMAMALDQEDDPDGSLASALENATGAWLYMADHLLRGDSRGGLPPEGFEYSPQAIGYVAQFLLALHTAGRDDPAWGGPQVSLPGNPFWNEIIPAYLNSLSPAAFQVSDPDWSWLEPVYLPAWYGDGQRYWSMDFISVFGPLGRYDDLTGNPARLDALRWIQTHLQPGGAEQMIPLRVAGGEAFSDPIFYFLLFDPTAPAPADPRPSTPLSHFVPGIGRSLHRTAWDESATWFTYALGWNTIDHQHCDGNQFEFYRGGEWLTKERTGYGVNIAASDYHNTLALENDPPLSDDPVNFPRILWERGSQWMLVPAGDPVILARGTGEDYVYFLGDATNLYNSTEEAATGILHASRSIVWLPPDHIVIYDRAVSQTGGRFKRFWLNLPAEPVIAGPIATMTTANGQHLITTTLLPGDAVISTEPAEPLAEDNEPAINEPMQFRLRVEAPGGPAQARFLHVLQGSDAGAVADEATLLESVTGTPFHGAVVGREAVLFPVEIGPGPVEFAYAAPIGTTRHVITGLEPDGVYTVTVRRDQGETGVSIRPGAGLRADPGGVLVLRLPG